MKKFLPIVFVLSIVACVAWSANVAIITGADSPYVKVGSTDYVSKTLRWNDIRVSLLSTNTGGSNPPGLVKTIATGASQGLFVFGFDRSIEEELYTTVQTPHDLAKVGHSLHPHVHWAPSDNSVATVVFGLEYAVYNIASSGPAATTIIHAIDGSGGVAYKHRIVEFNGHIDMTNMKDSAIIVCRFFREAGSSTDTYNVDALAYDLDFHAESYGPGSELEYGDN